MDFVYTENQTGDKFYLSIFGSCVSRDLLNYDTERKINLKSCFARQTIVSSIAEQCSFCEKEIQLESIYQKKAVIADLKKNCFEVLRNDGSDFLLLDIVEERLGILKWRNTFITDSVELKNAGCLDGTEVKIDYIYSEGDYYVGSKNLRDIFKEFCKRLLKIYNSKHIIILKADSKIYFKNKNGQIWSFPEKQWKMLNERNKMFDYMYALLEENIPHANIIDMRGKYYASETHRWGLSPVHYEDSWYEEVLRCLYQILDKEKNDQ